MPLNEANNENLKNLINNETRGDITNTMQKVTDMIAIDKSNETKFDEYISTYPSMYRLTTTNTRVCTD